MKLSSSITLMTLFVAFFSTAAPAESLSKRLRSFQLEFKDRARPTLPRDRILIFGSSHPQDDALNEYQLAVVRERLKRGGALSEVKWQDAIRSLPSSRKADEPDWDALLLPKLIVETTLREAAAPGLTDLTCHLTYIRYVNEESTIRPQLDFDRVLRLENVRQEDIRERIAVFLRTEIADLLPRLSLEKKAKKSVPYKGTLVYAEITPAPSALDRAEAAPSEPPSTALEVGVSVGNPSWVHLHAGVWGILEKPITLGFSGMYLGAATRGFTVHAGWIWDSTGNYEQAAEMTLAFFNDSQRTSQPVFDTAGQLISTELTTTHRLVPYLGPSYAVRWGSFKLSAGFGFRAGEGALSSVMPVIQFGWQPLIHF